jgi:hypothetical protein
MYNEKDVDQQQHHLHLSDPTKLPITNPHIQIIYILPTISFRLQSQRSKSGNGTNNNTNLVSGSSASEDR